MIEDVVVEETGEKREPMYDDDEDGNVLHGDGHETLIVHKSFIAPKGDYGDDWLRTNILHNTYTINDKVYKFIINS